jgi:serine/threonine protein kinase
MSELPQIPGYKIIRKLGQGGMADVYLGVQEKLAREVAIKVLIPSLFRDQQFSLRFIKEAQTAAKLVHPNIITIHDVGQVGDSYYIVMEYLEESLNDRIKRVGVLEPDEALKIVKMIAAALDYAHKKRFIHRDIKPDNIMFRPDGTAVLVDFGIARAIDSTTHLTRTGMSIGTPHYMSPEQCKGEIIDGRSDIYSLGVQLFELLTGTVPYKAENTAGIILKHIQEPIPKLPAPLSPYQPLIDKMMAKDREMRVQSGSELINFIDGLVTAQQMFPTIPLTSPEVATQEQPTIVRPQEPSPSISAQFRRERKKWPLMAGLIFAAVIVLGVSIFIITQKPTDTVDKNTEVVSSTVENKVEKETEKETSRPKEKEEIDITKEEKKTDAQDIKAKTDAQKPPEKKPEPIKKEAQISSRDAEYKTYLQRARDFFKAGEFDRARENLNEAEKRKKTPELLELKKTINQAKAHQQQLQEQQKPVKIPQKEVKPSPLPVKTATLLDLPLELRKSYNFQMQRIQITLPQVPKPRFLVKGHIVLNLFIDGRGRLSIQTFNSDMLDVVPDRLKLRVQDIIKNKLNRMSLIPPKNKAGETVQVPNWRVTFKVGKFFNKIILTKQ